MGECAAGATVGASRSALALTEPPLAVAASGDEPAPRANESCEGGVGCEAASQGRVLPPLPASIVHNAQNRLTRRSILPRLSRSSGVYAGVRPAGATVG